MHRLLVGSSDGPAKESTSKLEISKVEDLSEIEDLFEVADDAALRRTRYLLETGKDSLVKTIY